METTPSAILVILCHFLHSGTFPYLVKVCFIVYTPAIFKCVYILYVCILYYMPLYWAIVDAVACAYAC